MTVPMLVAVAAALKLSLIPSVVMTAMSFLVYGVEPSTNAMSGFQHLAAGIVLSAVAVELMPLIMSAPNDVYHTGGIIVGFLAGIATFLSLGAFCEKEDEEDAEEPSRMQAMSTSLLEAGAPRSDAHAHPTTPTPRPRLGEAAQLKSASKLGHVRACQLWDADEAARAPPYPVSLVVAVVVDASVDGFLIGLASANGTRANAGLVLAVALTIEMGFLGLTFASTMRKQPRLFALPSVLLPPLMLLLGAAGGACASAALAAQPALHVALVSFGAAALLYLVTEELLVEAHSGEGEHVWWVDLQFFVGFLASFLLEKFTGGGDE